MDLHRKMRRLGTLFGRFGNEAWTFEQGLGGALSPAGSLVDFASPRWPSVTKEESSTDFITEPQPRIGWREVDWNKESSQVDGWHDSHMTGPLEQTDLSIDSRSLREDEIEPGHVPGSNGKSLREAGLCEVKTKMGVEQNFPSSKSFSLQNNIEGNNSMEEIKAHHSKRAQKWEQHPDNPDKDTEISREFPLPSGRPWIEDDDELLLDLVEGGERNFVWIGQLLQRSDDDCHRRYQHLACLEVKEPRVGHWSVEQDAMLVRFVEEYKITDWDRIAFYCGTTTAEAHRYWSVRKPTISNQPVRRCNSRANTETSPRSSPGPVTAPDVSCPDDMPHSQLSSNLQAQHSKPQFAAAVKYSGIKAQNEVAADIAPEAIAQGRKRAFVESTQNDDEDEITQEQPKPKSRRIRTSEMASHCRRTGQIQVHRLRRSSRATKGKRKYDGTFLWYDPPHKTKPLSANSVSVESIPSSHIPPHKTKSLSKNSVSNDAIPPSQIPSSHPEKAHPDGQQTFCVRKPRLGLEKVGTTNGDPSDASAPISGRSRCGIKRSHVEIDEHDEVEATAPKRRCTGHPRLSLKFSKAAVAAAVVAAAAAPQAVVANEQLRCSPRPIKEESPALQEFIAHPVASIEPKGSGESHGRQDSLAVDTPGSILAGKTMKINLRLTLREEARRKPPRNLRDNQDRRGQTSTAAEVVCKSRRRARNDEADAEEKPRRRLLTAPRRKASH